jgi:hypothetical protein
MVETIKRYYPTGNRFVVDMNMDSCMEKYCIYKTIKEAHLSRKAKLIDLSHAYGEELVMAWIEAWLVNLAAYMNFDISNQQSSETAMFILEELFMLNIPEFTLLFKRIKKGRYGEFYGRFNGQIILRACKEFRIERGNIISKL